MRKILITNDDGIDADGIIRLARVARKYGEIWVVAPEKQMSATSHHITLRKAIEAHPVEFPVEGVTAYSCSGGPADCVRIGSLSIMPEKPDVVFSGINFGYNVASDIQYSGTAGAAFEAGFQQYRAIAFSEGANGVCEVTDKYLDEIIGRYIDEDIPEGHIININFPDCPLSEYKGVLTDRTVSRGAFFRDRYIEEERFEDGGVRLMVFGAPDREAEEGSDMRAVLDGYISVGLVNNIGYK